MTLINEEQKKLATILKSFHSASGGKIYFIPNEGNAGDALIAAGMWCFFEKIGITPIICTTEKLPTGSHSVYAGGGNLIDDYDNCRIYLETCLERNVAAALVLPHTIRGNTSILKRLDKRFTLFCREVKSQEWTKANASKANIELCDDMAFMLDLTWLKKKSSNLATKFYFLLHLISRPKQLAKYILWRLRKRLVRPNVEGLLEVYRVDVEATDLKPEKAGDDLSNLYGSKYLNKQETLIISQEFLDIINAARKIKTNRLHVAVGASLLNKDTTIFDNSYGKNSAIYYKSLTKYNKVRLGEINS